MEPLLTRLYSGRNNGRTADMDGVLGSPVY
jgi:hypothetical protein